MSMTKKDYVAIAAPIAFVSETARNLSTPQLRDALNEAVKYIALSIANYAESQSPTFDRERFLNACGVAK